MNAMIHGIPVTLIELRQTGVDGFGVPVYEETSVEINNVVVSPASEQEQLETVNLYGKKAIYSLHIPKDDVHRWTDTYVEFFGERWRTIGKPKQYMQHLVPLEWNLIVRVESVS